VENKKYGGNAALRFSVSYLPVTNTNAFAIF